MSFGSSHDTREQVRQATDIVELVGRSVTLRRQGTRYVGLCPWHDDSRPSLQINPQRQSWKCWVCDIGGDVFNFVMKVEGVGFGEALRILAERAGIPLARHAATAPGSPDDKQTLYRAVAWAEEQFHHCLTQSPSAELARQYLRDRGIDAGSVAKFRLGYSPDTWQWLMDRAKAASFSPAVLDAAGLVSKTADGRRMYDRFRGRLIFSIRDTEHRPIAFGARVLPPTYRTAQPPREQGSDADPGPKYVNTPETRLFSKSNQLYALDLARDALGRDPHIVVMEGYTDVIMAHQHGLRCTVAVLGTALGERHVSLLRRFADRITLVLDGDEAGQRRTNEILELFISAQADLRVLTLPEGLDPCDYLRQYGVESLQRLLAKAVDALEHRFLTATRGIDVTSNPDHAHRAIESILRTMAGAPQSAMTGSESVRLREQQMVARLARHFHVDESAVRARLAELRKVARSRSAAGHKPGAAPAAGPAILPVQLTPRERELFEILVLHPELVEAAFEAIASAQLTSAAAHALWNLYASVRKQQLGCDFCGILTATEDPALKNLLVDIDERARRKANDATEVAEDRLLGLVRDFHFQQQSAAQRQALAALENRGYDEKEELAVLERIIQQERDRQGISAPTDG